MVNTMFRQVKQVGLATAIGLLTLGSGMHATAAPGTLATAPLFLSNAVEPNIFYTLDDSGSMEWETMVSNGTAGIAANSGIPNMPHARYYILPTNGNGRDGWWGGSTDFAFTLPSTNLIPLAWVIRNADGNKLYYNPDINYQPWSGSDTSGNPLYPPASPSNAEADPNNATAGSINLTTDITYRAHDGTGIVNDTLFPATYFEWIDTDSNGVLDATDGNVRIEIKPANAPFPSGRSYNDEIQNFANWFQYYRKRSFVAKSALGRVINNTDASRMGLDIYNGGHQQDAGSMSDPTIKSTLLSTLYNLGIHCGPGNTGAFPATCNGTPARNSLDRIGRLFEGATGNPSPIQSVDDGGECQQNFGLIMSDGFWNGGQPGGIGNADSGTGGGFDGDATESNDGGNYEDSFSVTLADVAMHYYERDLSGLDNKVPVIAGVNEASHQHMVTYTIGFGLTGTLDPVTADPVAGGSSFWPDPMDAFDDERVDDLFHAAYNGRGLYLSAQNPEELEESLLLAIQDIAERTATAAAVAVTASKLTAGSSVYVTKFDSNRWQGNLNSFGFADIATGQLNTTGNWMMGGGAAAVLDARDLTTDNRTVLTYADGSDGIPFNGDTAAKWAQLTTAMKDDLKTNAAGGTDSDAVAKARLEFIRGSRLDEGQGNFFRERVTRLGDIIHSSPVFVGPPALNWPDASPFPTTSGSKYSDFKDTHSRNGVVYVGANDGMLHGFDQSTGREVLAYVPSNLFSTNAREGLHYLTQQNYIHQYYNDLTPTVSDVFINSAWRTVMISGQRGGGRGYSALDVTNPSTFNESNAADIVMWEFNSDDDPDLGFTFSRPQIGMTNDGNWVAIVGNGYNNTGDGEAKLFIINIQAGTDGTWDSGDYIEISTGTGTPGNPNGLATPALADIDGNGTIDRVYAGDLDGQMWAFDLSSSSIASWGLAYGAGKPLFTTENNEPITIKPSLAFHPTQPSSGSNAPNIMVLFGSGQFMVDADKNSTNLNYFYGVWDSGSSNLTRSNLIEQTFSPSLLPDRVLTQNPVDYSTHHGWNIKIPDSGERSITNPAVRGDIVFFNTSVPSVDPCAIGGIGYRFTVDLATGGTPSEPVVDINDDGTVDSNDTIGSSHEVLSAEQLSFLPTDNTLTEELGFTGTDTFLLKALTTPHIGRFSWQELLL